MAALSVCGDCDLTSAEDLSADYVQFLVARYHSHPIACGALVVKDIDWAEVKRMYVRPVVRRKGLSRAILDHLLDMAKRRGLRKVRLETHASKQRRSRSIVALALNPAIPTKITSQRRDRTLCLWSYSFSAIGPFCPRWRC